MCLSCVLDLVVDLDAARKHVSLHFDGVLLSAELVEAVEIQHEHKAFVAIAEAEILRRTGFCVIIHKKFQSLWQIFFEQESQPVRVSTINAGKLEILLDSRNCIASTYAYLMDDCELVAEIVQKDDRVNTRAHQHGYRCYKDWNFLDAKHHLKPSFTLPCEAGALFCVHVHLSLGPYCFAAKAITVERLEIFYEGKIFNMTVDAFQDMLSECCEAFSTVFFCVESTKPTMTSSEEQLLDLVAGIPSPQGDLCGGAEDTEADVDVGDQLRDLLQREVQDLLKALKTAKGSAFPSQVCPLCPWRRFDKRCLLVTHVTKHHSASKRFVASGPKQLRIIASMYDADAVRNEISGKYLRRSAELLRKQLTPQCSSRKNSIDTHFRLCMGGNGPFFMSTKQIGQAQNLRRVGNVYYNRSFANAFMCNAVASRCPLSDKLLRRLQRLRLVPEGS